MGTQFYFDAEIASKFSVEEAIFVHCIHWWCWKNECNEKNFADGRYWTYNTAKALSKLFPFWSVGQINRIVKKCEEHGLILTRTSNKKAMDKTRNFTITDFVKSIYRNQQIDLSESQKPFDDSKKSYNEQLVTTVTNTVNKQAEPFDCLNKELRKQAVLFVGENNELRDALDGFCQMRSKRKKPIQTERQLKLLINRLQNYSKGRRDVMCMMLDISTENGWTSIYEPKMPFPQETQRETKRTAGEEF